MIDRREHIIASLAILKVNWDDEKDKDYLHPFAEMLAEVIFQYGENVLTVDKLQSQYQSLFRLKLPAGVIKTLLRRLEKRKYVISKSGYYAPNLERLKDRNFGTVRQDVLDRYDSLASKFIDYCRSKFGTSISQRQAEEYLESFLAEHQLDLLNTLITRKNSIISWHSSNDPSHMYMTGSFITEIAQSQTTEFDYLETVLKGLMLVNVLYLPDNKTIKKRWTTAFYFDTPFLIETLGYQGNTKKDLRLELLAGLKRAGAKIRCFEHNVEEVRSILFAGLNIIERGNFASAYGPMATTIDHMVEENYTPADLLHAISEVETDLRKHDITVYEKPEYVRDYVVDEEEFESLLRGEYSGNGNDLKERQIKNDIDSVASIFRLRKGRRYSKIEDCRAVFVTHNMGLLRASHKFFGEREYDTRHCLTDFAVSNLVWLQSPDSLPDMPRKQIIADAFAATQPDARLWRRYISKIDELRNRGEIAADDLYAFRFTQEARASLMEVTRGSGVVLTDGNVKEIVRSVKSKFNAQALSEASVKQAELQRQADVRSQQLTCKLAAVQRERQLLIEEKQRAEERRKLRSRQIAKPIFTAARVVAGFASLLAWGASSPLHVLSVDVNAFEPSLQFVSGILLLIPLGFFVWELKDGKGIRNRLDNAERKFVIWIEGRLE